MSKRMGKMGRNTESRDKEGDGQENGEDGKEYRK
jgi:hypothetical protein